MNNINNKMYIGKTLKSIEKRFKEHCRDSKRTRDGNRPLYRAIRKYGENEFSISLIEQCDDDCANEREQYWIKYYDSYKNGYNATLGGDGKYRCDRNAVVKMFEDGCSQKEIMGKYGYDRQTCRNILVGAGYPYTAFLDRNINKEKKPVKQIDIDTGETIAVYPSINEAARIINAKHSSAIGRVIHGGRKSAYGYKWEFA